MKLAQAVCGILCDADLEVSMPIADDVDRPRDAARADRISNGNLLLRKAPVVNPAKVVCRSVNTHSCVHPTAMIRNSHGWQCVLSSSSHHASFRVYWPGYAGRDCVTGGGQPQLRRLLATPTLGDQCGPDASRCGNGVPVCLTTRRRICSSCGRCIRPLVPPDTPGSRSCVPA